MQCSFDSLFIRIDKNIFHNNHPSDQNSQNKEHRFNIFHLLLYTGVVQLLLFGLFSIPPVFSHFSPAPFITELKTTM